MNEWTWDIGFDVRNVAIRLSFSWINVIQMQSWLSFITQLAVNIKIQ